MDWLSWLVIVLLAGVIALIKFKESISNQPKALDSKVNYANAYQRKYLLTKNEWYEYKKLKQYADSANLLICPKVRLLDILEPRKEEGNYMSLSGKIQSKHVDFLICDQNLHIVGVLELDDNSHNEPKRKEQDTFVDQILQSVGYKVLHTKAITETTLEIFLENDPGEVKPSESCLKESNATK